MERFLLEQVIGPKGPLAGETVKRVTSIKGGCIHQAWRLDLSNEKSFFAKTTSNESFEMLEFEAIGLKSLEKYSNDSFLVIPQPIYLQKFQTASILLLPWVNMHEGNEINLGKGLALLHKCSAESNHKYFGWKSNGYIGSGPQPGGIKNSWGDCFINLRLIPQMKIAKKWGLDLNKFTKLLSKLIEFLNEHSPSPSLVHGDLWKGNAAINEDQQGIIFDPAIWWADREVDIAMTKLFGGFSKNFYEAYEAIWPLPESAQTRNNLYNLYHLLNHANLFDGYYKNQCIDILTELEVTFLNE